MPCDIDRIIRDTVVTPIKIGMTIKVNANLVKVRPEVLKVAEVKGSKNKIVKLKASIRRKEYKDTRFTRSVAEFFEEECGLLFRNATITTVFYKPGMRKEFTKIMLSPYVDDEWCIKEFIRRLFLTDVDYEIMRVSYSIQIVLPSYVKIGEPKKGVVKPDPNSKHIYKIPIVIENKVMGMPIVVSKKYNKIIATAQIPADMDIMDVARRILEALINTGMIECKD